jgi:hypothetical protein
MEAMADVDPVGADCPSFDATDVAAVELRAMMEAEEVVEVVSRLRL